MLQSFLMFFAPAGQAAAMETVPPPATARPEPVQNKGWLLRLKTALCIAGNSLGFLLFIAGAWIMLQLLQILLVPLS